MDLVSIVIPTFNGARFLDATLDSVQAQSHGAIETIVVDDGSTDQSVDIARVHPIRPTVITQPNRGVAVARNHGMAIASGRWVAFLDQDDVWHRSRVRTLVDVAEAEHSLASASSETSFAVEGDRERLIAVGDGRHHWVERWISPGEEQALIRDELSPDSQSIEHLTLEQFLAGAVAVTCSFLYDRLTAISAGGCAVHARAIDDHVLATNVARLNGGSIPRATRKDLFYRVHPASTTTVSPLAGPALSMMAALRLGGVFPDHHYVGTNVEHLLWGLADSDLTVTDQLALLMLTTRNSQLRLWIPRWLRGRARRLRRQRPRRS